MYTPNNVSVFTAAFAGALAGMGVGAGVLTDPTEADYDGIATIALAFAESFDTQWGGLGINQLVIDEIQCCCEESFSGRPCHPIGPPLTTAANWTTLSNAIIALVRAGNDTVTGQGITPLPFPPTGTIPARGYSVNPALITLNAGSQVCASVTLTPTVSGKLKIRVSGVVENGDSSGTQHPITLNVNDGTNTLQTQDTQRTTAAGAGHSTTTLAFNVDSDHATIPETYPVGTPVTINASVTGDASGQITIAAHGIQLEVQEAQG